MTDEEKAIAVLEGLAEVRYCERCGQPLTKCDGMYTPDLHDIQHPANFVRFVYWVCTNPDRIGMSCVDRR